MNFLYIYLISIPVFMIVDLLWLGVVARSFYQDKLGHLLGSVNWPAAIVFYLIFLLGLTYFAISPAVESGNLMKAVTLGALFGFFTYATYDLTNQATIKDWPLIVTVVDMIWGVVLGSAVAAATFFISTSLFSG